MLLVLVQAAFLCLAVLQDPQEAEYSLNAALMQPLYGLNTAFIQP
jgi:hypothetical protein